MEKKDKNNFNRYLRFSSVAIQMGVIIAAGAWGGDALDQQLGNTKPIFTIIFSLVAIFASLYLTIREILKMSKKDDNQDS